VLAEVLNRFGSTTLRIPAAAFLEELEHDPDVKILGHSDALYERGLTLYRARPDKEWSLTDCISFVVMHEQNITDALTGDHHFAQAGFVPLFAEG